MIDFRTCGLAIIACTLGCDGLIGGTQDKVPEGQLPACNPPLAITPSGATVAPLALLQFSASGGNGGYAFDIVENLSDARINTDDGSYLAGPIAGVLDSVRVTAADCSGEAIAVIAIPEILDVKPSRAEVPPGNAFTLQVSRGSGSFSFELTSNGSGASITDNGTYKAGAADGVDVVRVTDAVTKSFKDVVLTVDKDAVLIADPPHLALPAGSQTVLHSVGGSSYVSVDATGGIAIFEDGVLKALTPGALTLTMTDTFTRQTATMTLDVSVPFEAPFARGGDKDTFRSIYMPAIAGDDLDADGRADVVVGYADTSYDAALSGAVYVYRGAPGLVSRWQPSLTLSGIEARERFGHAVAIGDFDGNGAKDLAVGSPNSDAIFVDAGVVRIFPGAPATPELFSRTASQTIGGAAPQDTAGSGLAACDFNGDGITDLAVGVPLGESSSTATAVRNQGDILIIKGSTSGLDIAGAQHIYGELPDVNGSMQAIASLQIGAVLAAADFDGNGRCELVSAAPGYAPTGTTTAYGALIVYSFDDTGTVMEKPAMVIRSVMTSATTELGRGIALRDIDGDGKPEILTGERNPGKGRALVFKALLDGTDTTTASAAVALAGAANGDLCGGSVDAADANGDGAAELYVGCIGPANSGLSGVGAVRVYTGINGGMPSDPPSRTIFGGVALDRFGNVVTAVGDVNGDGHRDLVVHVRDGDTEGVNFGSMSLVSTDADVAPIDMALPGRSSLQQNGASVAMIGDLNADGFEEIAVGVPLANVALGTATNDGIDAGRVLVYSGKQTAPLVVLEKHALHFSGDQLGSKVARLGDFDGDGNFDLAVVAAKDTKPTTYPEGFSADATCPGTTGGVYIYGSTNGTFDTTPKFVLFGPGSDVVSITGDFDFNGDGKRDFVIGGTTWNALEGTPTNVGGMRIYLGQAATAGTVKVLCAPAVDVRGFSTGDRLGIDVVSLGDIDGDGCDEVGAGMDGYESSTRGNEGGVLVVYGAGASCANASPRYAILNSTIASAAAGRALAAADLDRRTVSGRMVNELVVTSSTLARAGGIGGAWVVRGDTLAAMAPTTTIPYPVTSFVNDPDAAVLIGPQVNEGFGLSVAIVPAIVGKDGIVLLGLPQSSDSGITRSGAVFGYRYAVSGDATADPGLDGSALLRIGGEATPDGRFGEALFARRTTNGVRVVVGALASDAVSQGGASIDDGAGYVFSMDSLR